MVHYRFLLITCLFLPMQSFALSQEQQYNDNLNWAKQSQQGIIGKAQGKLDINDYCADADCVNQALNPPQAGLDDAAINNKKTSEFFSNDTAGAIQDNFDKGRPDLKNDPDYQFALLGQENAYEISHGISNEYVDCQSGQLCLDKAIKRSCSAPTFNKVPCHKVPRFTEVTLGEKQQNFHATYGGHSNGIGHYYKYPTHLIAPQGVKYITGIMMPHISHWNVEGIAFDYRINGISVYRKWGTNSSCTVWNNCYLNIKPGYIKLPNPIPVSGGSRINLEFYLLGINNTEWRGEWWYSYVTHSMGTIYYSQPHYEYEWESSCDPVLPGCTAIDSQICVEGRETRVIEGVEVTLDCWKYEQQYQCDVDNTCDELAECTEDSRSCSLQFNGVCIEEEISKTCNVKECSPTSLQCGNDSFCLDGDCYDATPTTSDDFDKAAAGLAGLAEAAKNLGDPPLIFTGKGMKCTDKAFGFADCCKDGGWGTDIGISECGAEEKALGRAKEEGLSIYIGSYCASKFLGKCTRRKKTYCVYDSKLSRIIQQQGAKGQLGISLGSAKNPICAPITPEQLQQINFDRIDFSDFYEDMHADTELPSASEIQDRLESAFAQ
ncbi:type-F conjugative transfer system mating-pair stabilization protein TraN [Vibrio parahaemolyticus]|nr:type-F conjugative transfer system mating-pair stabilization protein TraN [Vibrio parahaemolyticus]